MGYAAPLRGRDFGGGDLNLSIDLHGVAVDDLAARPQREREAEFALARRGRADDGDDRLHALTPGVHDEGKRRRKRATSQRMVSKASAPTSCVRRSASVEETGRENFGPSV